MDNRDIRELEDCVLDWDDQDDMRLASWQELLKLAQVEKNPTAAVAVTRIIRMKDWRQLLRANGLDTAPAIDPELVDLKKSVLP